MFMETPVRPKTTIDDLDHDLSVFALVAFALYHSGGKGPLHIHSNTCVAKNDYR